MEPTTSGRFRIQDRRAGDDTRSDQDGKQPADDQQPADGHPGTGASTAPSFTAIELPAEPIAPDDPDAAEAYAPLHIDGEHAVATTELEPGYVVDATIGWTDGTARFLEYEIVRRTRIYVADSVTGMFEAAREAWNGARAAGESVVSTTTRGQDGEPNGALYLFPDGPDRDTLTALQSGRIPIEPLIARVNDRLDDGRDRGVFLLRPASDPYVAVLVAFDIDGILARTVRDTYDIGSALADRLDTISDDAGVYAGSRDPIRAIGRAEQNGEVEQSETGTADEDDRSDASESDRSDASESDRTNAGEGTEHSGTSPF